MLVQRILILPLIASIAFTGCQLRKGDGVAVEEYHADNQQQAGKIDALERDNAQLKDQLEKTRAQLEQAKNAPTVGNSLRKELKGEEIQGTTVTETGGLALSEDFAFAKGSADLNDDGLKTIEKIASRLNEGENAAAKVIVEGHTDDTPVARHATIEKYVDNWGLSAARAASVVRALQTHKVDAKRIVGRFRGEYAPRVTEGDKGKNRRVEIYLD